MSATVGVQQGVQAPRVFHTPNNVVHNDAGDAVALIREAGFPLDPWQEFTLETWLGLRADGSWAAQECGLLCARQSGKSQLLEARELAGLFLFGEQRIVHSAHQAATADESFKRMRNLVESVPWLDAEVAKILGSPGRQSIRLKSGGEISYRTRTKGGARGFSAPVVIFDEAQELTGEQLAAIVPVTSSFKNRQLIFTGTVLAGASVFQGLVERGRQHIGESLGYADWSADPEANLGDPDVLAAQILQANPGIGWRPGLTVEYCLNERDMFVAAGAEDKWLEERLSIWPAIGGVGSVIPVDAWQRSTSGWRPDEGVQGGVVAVAVNMARDYACVGYAIPSPKGSFVELVAQTGAKGRDGVVRSGIEWVLPYLVGLFERRRPLNVVVDKAGPAASLLNGMIAAQLPVRVSELPDWKAACNQFVDAVVQGRVEHSGQVQVGESAQGVQWRSVGDGQVYDRKTPSVNVAPVEAVSLAAWGLMPDPRNKQFFVMNLNDYGQD